jgi:hypothetical protein
MGRLTSVGIAIIFISSLFTSIVAVGQNTQLAPAQAAFSTSATSSDAPLQPTGENITTDDTALDPASLVPDLPPLPPAKASLIGGTVEKLDRVREEITVRVFGGGKMKIAFDSRTTIYRGNSAVLASDLHQGDRVYLATILDGSTVFARSIRVRGAIAAGESQGTVIGYRSDKGELLVRDALSPQPLKIRVSPQTRVVQGDHAASLGDLTPGTLVAIDFGALRKNNDVASQVSVLATPGASFTFAGQVTGLDLRLGMLVITSSTDHKTYEIYLDPATVSFDDSLRPGVDVTAVTNFDGSRYVARSLTVNTQ